MTKEMQKELEEELKQKTEVVEEDEIKSEQEQAHMFPKTFEQGIDFIKLRSLADAGNDENSRKENAQKSKEVIEAEIQLEKAKAEQRIAQVELEKLKLSIQEKKFESERFKNIYGDKLDEQEYVYRSLRPILETFWIHNPMNVIIMWIFAVLGFIPFLVKKLIASTIGDFFKGIIRLFYKEKTIKYEERLKPNDPQTEQA